MFLRTFSCILLCALHATAIAQVFDNFNDGDFTNNPAWVTSAPGDWVVNPSLQLQSNNTTANSTFWMSTPSTLALATQWDFWVRIDFNPSSTNLIDVYLTASGPNLSLNSTTGYVVRIGNTEDEISLLRKENTGAFVKIIDGADGVLNTSSSVIRIRVIRTAANQWTLLRDLTGTGNNFSNEGTVTDATYTTSHSFGFLVRQSTASFFQRHFFDDIDVKPYVPDVTPPAIVSATATSPTQLQVLFDEPVSLASAQQTGNYVVNNGIGNPVSAVRNAGNTALVELTFATPFGNGVSNVLTVTGVQDIWGNAISNGTANFSFYTPGRYDVVISEIMSDPSPPVGLPNVEWIEIRNTTPHAFNLQGWRVGRQGTNVSGPLPSFVLQPDSVVILCGTSAAVQMQAFGRTFGLTSFPSLPVGGSLIWIQNAAGEIIHATEYSPGWHENPIKADGGWTLELIDPRNPCAGRSNWRSSQDPRGGTPGARNSVHALNADQAPPQLLRAFALDSVTVLLTFNEPVDSLRGATAANYQISDGMGGAQSAVSIGPLFMRTQIRLATPLQRNRVYTVTVTNVTDCRGNTIGGFNTARVGLTERIDSLDLVINEVLFDPRGNGADFVELYNRSNKMLNLKDLLLANRNTAGAVANFRNLSADDQIIFPGSYTTLTDNAANIRREYNVANPDWLYEIPSLPSYPNDKGNVVLIDFQGRIVDELSYTDKWHFPLLDNKDGVSLERINPNGPTQNPENWTSAAKSAGYGTPTAQNSQFRQDLQVQGEVTVSPEVFSPDNDGFNDFLLISYRFPEPGYTLNITIFDAGGRPVKALQRNAYCGQTGSFRWDGLDDKFGKLPVGPYVVFTEVFNLQGKVKRFKNQVVLARRF
ncbi:MAG: lamin tail domain-containing protein [Lacibacter sp.]